MRGQETLVPGHPRTPPAPRVDQVTALYLERPGSVVAAAREQFDAAWLRTEDVHERARLVGLRDTVLGLVAEAEHSADVAHGLGLRESEEAA